MKCDYISTRHNKSFFSRLATRNRCWTSNRLARRGLPHQAACPLCDQHEESINHLLLHCIHAREVWAKILPALGMGHAEPRMEESLMEWCTRNGLDRLPRRRAKTVRATCLLVMWELWKHRNGVMFDAKTPCPRAVPHKIASECVLWKEAELLRG